MAGPTQDLGNLLIHLKADASQYLAVMKLAKSTLNKMTRWAKRAAIAMSAYAAISVKAFASFQEQMQNVATMLDDHTMNLMPGYGKAIQEMSREFGESTLTLTQGLYDILSAGIDASKAIDVLAVSAKAAKAGMTSTAIATDAITTVLNSYQMSADQAARISDILFATVKRGKLTFAELAPNLGKVTSLAFTAGLSFEEVSAAIATMTRAGLQADIATTSLRSIMNSFLKPTEDASSAARQFGLELNSTTLRTIGLTGVLDKLSDATAEQLAAIIPNVRGLSGFAAMLKQAKRQADDLRLMLNASGLTQKAYDKMTNTLIHSFRQFWQTMKVTSVMLGTHLQPAVQAATNTMKEYIATHQPQIGIVFVKAIRGMVEAVQILARQIQLLPTYWKQVDIEIWKVIITVYRVADAMTNLDKLFAWVRKDQDTFANRIIMSEGAIAKLELEIIAMAKAFVKNDAEATAFFNTFLKGLDEAQAAMEQDIAVQKMRERWKGVYEALQQTKDDMQALKDLEMDDEIDKMNQKLENTTEQLGPMAKELDLWAIKANDVWKRMGEAGSRALDTISGTLTELVMKGKADFKEMAKSILADILQIMIRWRLAQALMGIAPTIFPGTSATTATPMMPIPETAAGGIVTKPTVLIAGEGGESEAIIPLSKMGNFGTPPSVVINNQSGVQLKQQGPAQLELDKWVVTVVAENVQNNGILANLGLGAGGR